MSEITRLGARMKFLGMTDFHISWTSDGHRMSAEKKAWHMNRILDEIEAGKFTPMDPADFDRPPRPFAPLMETETVEIPDIEAISR